MILSVDNLYKFYGAQTALAGINLTITQGEKIAVMGSSGAGKSTLIKCLSGQINIDGGNVFYDQVNLKTFSKKQLAEIRREDFGFVFQNPVLLPEFTLGENLALPLYLSGYKKRIAEKIAFEWLEMINLENLASAPARDCSPGQQQQTAILRALIHQPKVIFADEPTSALDQVKAQEMMQILHHYAQVNQITLCLVTHDQNIANWCSRKINLQYGLLVNQEE